jgi:ABC-type multidrug transport system fused ATPase/permease subunit
LTTITTVAQLLTRTERLQLLALGVAMLVVGIGEMLGVASVLPFMQLIADPGALQADSLIARIAQRLGFVSKQDALFASGVFLLVIIALNNLLSAGTQWLVQRYSWALNHRLSTDLLRSYLEQPYAFFLGRNTSDLNRTLLAAVNSVVTGVVIPALQAATRAITAVLIIGVAALADLQMALLLGLVIGGAYGAVYGILKRSQHRMGWEQFNNNGRRFLIAQEALGGIKDVKMLGREAEFLRRFDEPSRRYSVAAAHNQIVGRIPRYALETIAIGAIMAVLLFAIRNGKDVGTLLPQLTLYAFAAFRLMPALNELFANVIQIRFNTAALESLHHDLTERWQSGAIARPATVATAPVAASPDASAPLVELRDVGFRYAESDRQTLEGISLRVEPRQVIGLVGTTGAGKTTIVDLILGLLQPTSGEIRIDGVVLTEASSRSWRMRCGYVPQVVFLSDDTIAANIAFGIPDSEIDPKAVRRAAEIAQLHEFVEGLSEGYATVIGERGVRLSGGQRQRIGIARALYHDPDVLVMDEATNALDSVTETAVIDTINSLARQKTLIVIAHRLSTVRECDCIYLLDGGRVASQGTFAELFQNDARFRAMAGESSAGEAASGSA